MGAERIACIDFYAHVLNEYKDAELAAALEVGSGKKPFVESGVIEQYKEAQYHGPIEFDKHVEALVAHKRHKRDGLKKNIEHFCQKNAIQLRWTDEPDPDPVTCCVPAVQDAAAATCDIQ